MVSDGDILAAIQMDREAIARAGGIHSFGLARSPLTLYWAGLAEEAIQRGLQAVETARASQDPPFLLRTPAPGLSLSAQVGLTKRCVCSTRRVPSERDAARFLLARATSMSVAPLLSLGDLNGAMARASTRELAHRVAFEPPLVSAGIDLLMIRPTTGPRARRHAAGRDCAGRAESQRLACMEMEHAAVAGASRTGVRPRFMERSRSSGNLCDRSEPVSTSACDEALGLLTRVESGASAGSARR